MSNQYQSTHEVPLQVMVKRLDELVKMIIKEDFSEFYMCLPAEYDRDADLVIHGAATRLIELDDARIAAESRAAQLEQELNQAKESHAMQLAAISVAAMQDTTDSRQDRIGEENPYWSLAYADTCRKVDQLIDLREKLAELERQEPVVVISRAEWDEMQIKVANNRNRKRM